MEGRDRYLVLVTALPIPTVEQTEAFARFVAGAHSWYKHLPPFPPGAPFVFFLDPNAGRALVSTETGQAYQDRVDERERFHYTWMKTAEYRARFGHWAYSEDRSPSFAAGAGKAWTVLTSRAAVMAPDGEWVAVSPRMLEAGAARVTGAVHELFDPFRAMCFHGERAETFLAEARAEGGTLDADRAAVIPLCEAIVRGRAEVDQRPVEKRWEDPPAGLRELVDAERARQQDAIRDALLRVLAFVGN